MDNHQNSTDPLREEFETAISELTPDERAELLKMIRQRKAEKDRNMRRRQAAALGGVENERYQRQSVQSDSFS